MPGIKLICFDLDGTILEEGEYIPEDTRKVLEESVRLGIKVSTASGRSLSDQLRILEHNNIGPDLGWPHALITDESYIHILDGNIYIPLLPWNQIVNRVWRRNLNIARLMLLKDLDSLRERGIVAHRVISDEDAKTRSLIGILFERLDDALSYERDLSRKISELDIELQCNRNDCFVQILPAISGKGNTVSRLANYFGIRREEVLVIGNSGNDLSMLNGNHDFYPATVSNGEEIIKRTVLQHNGYIATSPLSKGIIEIINNVVLKREMASI